MGDYAEQQEMEIEALQSILMDDLKGIYMLLTIQITKIAFKMCSVPLGTFHLTFHFASYSLIQR